MTTILPRWLYTFFFEKISSRGFGMLRITWASLALMTFLMQWSDRVFLYGNYGLVPQHLGHLIYRYNYRMSILDMVGSANGVTVLYVLLLTTLTLVLIGKYTRTATILSFVLIASFHERNHLALAGGDTVLRVTGFLLAISPGIDTFSLDRRKQPVTTMSIWPYRLLLWQIIVIYVTSGLDKLAGAMWRDGTAPSIALHHEHFSLLSRSAADTLSFASSSIAAFTLLFEFLWIGLLIPPIITRQLPLWIPRIPLKRTLILAGVVFHLGIALTMDVGNFSLAMCMLYIGLLQKEDMEAIATISGFVRKKLR